MRYHHQVLAYQTLSVSFLLLYVRCLGTDFYSKLVAFLLFTFVHNFVTFLVYKLDKEYAENDSCWRIPENILHLFCLCFGLVGALLAMSVFRHKTKKSQFLKVSFTCSCISMVLYAALATVLFLIM